MRQALISTALHTLEMIVPILAAILVVRYFDLGSDDMAILVGLVLNSISKFARASDLPIRDFVNE